MRKIDFDKIAQTVESLCISAAYELPDDIIDALKTARKKESHAPAADILDKLITNAELASSESIPLCQDTGLAVIFVELGADVTVCAKTADKQLNLIDALNAGVAAGYENGYLRKSVVAEPLNERINTGTNTPAIIHITIVPGDKLKISLITKGGGCENKSRIKIFPPTAKKQQIIDYITRTAENAGADACPPFIIGVGIGGDFELAAILSKKALLRPLSSRHYDPFYAELEEQTLEKINQLGLGPQGMGGHTTALACLIETAPCHIASLPVAVNIDCHSHRHKSATL